MIPFIWIEKKRNQHFFLIKKKKTGAFFSGNDWSEYYIIFYYQTRIWLSEESTLFIKITSVLWDADMDAGLTLPPRTFDECATPLCGLVLPPRPLANALRYLSTLLGSKGIKLRLLWPSLDPEVLNFYHSPILCCSISLKTQLNLE